MKPLMHHFANHSMPPRSHDGVTRLRDVRSHCHHHAVGEILQEKQGGDSENGGRRSKNWIDQWRSGKLSTGSRVHYSVSRAFAFSFGVALSKSAHYANHAELSHSAQIDVEISYVFVKDKIYEWSAVHVNLRRKNTKVFFRDNTSVKWRTWANLQLTLR